MGERSAARRGETRRLSGACILLLLAAAAPAPGAEPPWAQDPAEFLSAAGARHWVIGRSTSSCLSAEEAIERACVDAAAQITAPISAAREREWIRQRLEADLRTGRLLADRSLARIQRPYGELWRAAILVDASPERIASIERESRQMTERRRSSLFRQIVAGGGVLAGILLFYGLADALTRGYFRGRLRAGAAVSLLAVGSMMLWLLQSAG